MFVLMCRMIWVRMCMIFVLILLVRFSFVFSSARSVLLCTHFRIGRESWFCSDTLALFSRFVQELRCGFSYHFQASCEQLSRHRTRTKAKICTFAQSPSANVQNQTQKLAHKSARTTVHNIPQVASTPKATNTTAGRKTTPTTT